MGSCGGLTVKDRASEEHQKLDEHVLLLGTQLVPAESLPSVFDIIVGNTLLDVYIKPFLWNGAIFFRFVVCLLGPELSCHVSGSYGDVW